MEEEIKLKKDYLSIFRAAEVTGNTDEMSRAFFELCDELGVPDPGADEAAKEFGKLVAEKRNAVDQGKNGKQI